MKGRKFKILSFILVLVLVSPLPALQVRASESSADQGGGGIGKGLKGRKAMQPCAGTGQAFPRRNGWLGAVYGSAGKRGILQGM